MNPEVIFWIIIGILTLSFVFGLFISWLNAQNRSEKLPDELMGIYDEEKYAKSQQYENDHYRLGMLTSSVSFALLIAILMFSGFAWLQNIVEAITENSIFQALLFLGIIGLAADILSTPFSVYSTFVIEEKYGFNRTTPKTFLTDKLKGWLLAAILGGGLFALIMYLYLETGSNFWWIAWLSISVFSLFLTMFYARIIVPLFNKQRPLEEGTLRNAIAEYANNNGIKIKNIFVIDGSKRSSKSNAYFTGIGPKKRIVLYDTLINDHTADEIVAVLAHEVGHWKKKHTTYSIAFSIIQTGLMLYLLSLFLEYPVFAQSLGIPETSFHIGLLVFGILFSPVSTIINIGMNMYSRHCEYQADAFAAKTYKAESLVEALKKLSVNHLSNLQPHPLYVFINYSHPPLLQRIQALARHKRDKPQETVL